MNSEKVTLLIQLRYWIDADGHTVGVFTHPDGDIDGVGYNVLCRGDMLPDADGVLYRVTGKIHENSRNVPGYTYCEHELEVMDYEPMLDNICSVKHYLSSLYGIGDKKASTICDALGVSAIEKIRADYKILTTIRGISEKTAISIKDQLNDYEHFKKFREFMLPYGMSSETVASAYGLRRKNERYPDAIGYYKRKPYSMLSAKGATFELVDKFALSVGIAPDSNERKYKAAYEVLRRAGRCGHTALKRDDFISLFERLTGIVITPEDIKASCNCAQIAVRGKTKEVPYVLTRTQYNFEKDAACKLRDIVKNVTPINKDITELEIKDRNEHLDMAQTIAVKNALASPISLITGGPGTGKTTVIKSIIKECKLAGYDRILLLAPTGKAARRMEESTGYRAMTIHRGLKFRPDDDVSELEQEIVADIIIVDEMSMVDFANFSKLLAKIRPTRLVLVGDIDQLSSVGPGRVFGDLLDVSRVIGGIRGGMAYISLDRNHRQGKGSTISRNASLINACNPALIADDTFVYDWEADNAKIAEKTVEAYVKQADIYGIDSVVVLSPVKAGVAGVRALNKTIQNIVNPYAEDKPQVTNHGEIFRVGDIVMQLVNDDDVVNGDVGTIISIEGDTIMIEYSDNRVIPYTKAKLSDVTLAYAMTVHKSQGSEYKSVIYCMPSDINPAMQVKNIPYTAITRAKETVRYIGTWETLCKSLMTANPNKRISLFPVILDNRMSGDC